MMEDPIPPSSTARGHEHVTTATTGTVKILCCMCGIPIDPNPSNTCATCLASTSDVTRGISTEATLHQCRGCQRWHKEGGKWTSCELESRDLMALCLSKVSGLRNTSSSMGKKVRLVDAGWIWTEPHSMRLKIRLTIQREVRTATILQQSFVVTFIVRNQQCVECQASFRQGSWKSLVQVRQRVCHKRTFLYLEQMILKHGAHRGCLSIETFKDGMDFYFPDKGKAARFLSFLENVVPVKVKTSKKLIGMDDKSNVANFKYTNLAEICPLCKDDLLFLPTKIARNMGNIARLVLVKNVTNLVHLVDPLTGQIASLSPEIYWRNTVQQSDLRPLLTAGRYRFTRFVVLGKEAASLERNVSRRRTSSKQRNKVAVVTVAREEDLGKNDVRMMQASHVGYLLRAGDVCVGYDLTEARFVNDDAEEYREQGKLPDAVIVRKLYGAAATTVDDLESDEIVTAGRKRIWRMKRLDVDITMSEASSFTKGRSSKRDTCQIELDEEEFMREVEADKEMRRNMFLYKSEELAAAVSKRKEKNGERVRCEDNFADAQMDDGGEKMDDKRKKSDKENCYHNGEEDEDDDDQAVRLDELLDSLALDAEPYGMDEVFEKSEHNDDESEEPWGIQHLLPEGERAAKDGISYVGREDSRAVKDKDAPTAVGSTFGDDLMKRDFKFT